MASKARILALVTSADRYLKTGQRTGLWLGELTHVYDVLTKAGHRVDIVSVSGGTVPLDPMSLMPPVLKLGATDKRYEDPRFMALLDDTDAIDDVDPDDYDAIFLAGGHGAMFDFVDFGVAELVAAFADEGKVVAAVCHGPAGLLDVQLAHGTTLLAGRKVTGFSWVEEKAAARAKAVPFNLQKQLKAEAGRYVKARLPMAKKVVVDGNLITGQNPTSATGVGEAMVKALKRRTR
ncbi:MAG: type 1 glutamine amidotransferase domain-containing protein [Propionibacteriaceae bacterium]|nr:type 1 glutamine amidotransferase domain-containing protein [Propionibacteriaceae bacterium]